MKHEDLTQAIIGCAFDVINELGSGFLESVYERAMSIALRQRGFTVVAVYFRGHCVGDCYADLFVENVVLVELKAVKAISPEHQAQIINYLIATRIDVGLLINFGNAKLEYKRLMRRIDKDRQAGQDEIQNHLQT